MNSNEIEPGDSLSLPFEAWRSLRQIINNTSRFPEVLIDDAVATRSELNSLLALRRILPREGYEYVHITATDAQDTSEPNISVSETGVLHFDLPVEVARVWFAIAGETINHLGDPEAHYVTGETTGELRQAAKLLRRENWGPGMGDSRAASSEQ